MEAYALCVKDLLTKKSGVRIGKFHCLLFGLAFVFLSSWAVYWSLSPFRVDPDYDRRNPWFLSLTTVFEREWFGYVIILFCLSTAGAGYLFINGIKRSNLRKLLPFLVLNLVGIKLSPDFISLIEWGIQCYAVTKAISFSLSTLHIFSFFWTLTYYLQLKYTPEKLLSHENIRQTL